ncbi:murein biosynthesis integral membrane protein MurJ [Sodalis-like secondary symbiont of Drepanosiphum platanoidis]|uniref:murein biosynthesis integral membrane protein MurJ n=1 Tax=Sodalis-like secondary symbiont of Drepanosiphum platanoidis TaxID=2994493 RepID=UPI003464473E
MNIIKNFFNIGLTSIISRIFGLARDIILATIFGSGIESDSFFISFKLSNILRNIFADGAFSKAFIPVFIEYKNKKKKLETNIFLSSVFLILILTILIVVILGLLNINFLIIFLSPGIVNTPEKLKLTLILSKIIFPYILFVSLTSFISNILNTFNYFFVTSLSSILLNISIIIFSLLAKKYFNPPIKSLAWGVIFGGFLQLIYHIYFLKKIKFLKFCKIQFFNKGVKKVLKLMTPSIVGVFAYHIFFIINSILSSFLIPGSISWIYYSNRIIEFPIGILGHSISNILLYELSKKNILKKKMEYSLYIEWAIRICLIVSIPCTVLFICLSKYIIITLFQYGKFSSFDTRMTQKIFLGYSIGLAGFILVKVLEQGFYAIKNSKTPVKISILSLIFIQVINITCIFILKNYILSFSLSIGSYFHSILLYWKLKKNKLIFIKKIWLKFLLQVIASTISMYIILTFLIKIFLKNLLIYSISLRFLYLLIVILISIFIYIFSLYLFGYNFKKKSIL